MKILKNENLKWKVVPGEGSIDCLKQIVHNTFKIYDNRLFERRLTIFSLLIDSHLVLYRQESAQYLKKLRPLL